MFHYVHICKTAKKMWDALKLIYRDFSSIKQEKMNTWDNDNLGCFSKFTSIRKFVGNCVTNKNLRIKNWKFNPTLKSIDGSLHEFQKKSRMKEVIEKMNKPVRLLKDEGTQTKESSSSSYSYHVTSTQSFERTYSIVEWSLGDSTLNEGSYYSKNDQKKMEKLIQHVEQKRRGERTNLREKSKRFIFQRRWWNMLKGILRMRYCSRY